MNFHLYIDATIQGISTNLTSLEFTQIKLCQSIFIVFYKMSVNLLASRQQFLFHQQLKVVKFYSKNLLISVSIIFINGFVISFTKSFIFVKHLNVIIYYLALFKIQYKQIMFVEIIIKYSFCE